MFYLQYSWDVTEVLSGFESLYSEQDSKKAFQCPIS